MTKHKSVEHLLQKLIQQPYLKGADDLPLVEWYRKMRVDTEGLETQGLSALQGGFYANSAGQAFVFGYEVAIQRLTGLDTQEYLAAFCVTENKSAHPQAMQTSLTKKRDGQWMLTGKKDFVTMACNAKWLLVAAKSGLSGDGRNQIKLVKVDVSASGVDVLTHPPLPFIPDVSHGAVTFDSVLVEGKDIYPGDGYANFVKPFRWFEDINVFISLTGYLLKLALTNQWPVSSKVEIMSILVTLVGLQQMDADEPMAHILMFDQAAKLACWLDNYDDEWEGVSSPVAAAWKRDRGIMSVANYARSARYKKALSRMALA
ncbi:acyl-CoA dehydrogenase family protein [Alkalimarinus alittae]|uniref:Acyl-CoA dehydrogenase family protein n=1 Tax=Alkalimarinus alittae TaxID=2961619 RepID=A0ABY6N602_9ALTE|nr:acyl-CoA dehydrogenase family protein [Alkalimarinus alittae]UZE97440.1 acyl-CoA dehydrogenase family protein [Alkalimarinus alittae]